MKQISYEELHRRGYAKHEVSDMVDEGTIEWDEDLGAFLVWGELYKQRDPLTACHEDATMMILQENQL